MVKKDWKKTSRGYMKKNHSMGIKKTIYRTAWKDKPYEKNVNGVKFKVEVYKVIRDGIGKTMIENLYKSNAEANKFIEGFVRSN